LFQSTPPPPLSFAASSYSTEKETQRGTVKEGIKKPMLSGFDKLPTLGDAL